MVLFVVLFELFLSFFKIIPIRFFDNVNEPTVYERDSILGWKGKEGEYIFPPYSPSGSEINFSILKGGIRKTSPKQGNNRENSPKMVFCGGSFAQGWAISDNETLPWKIQKELNDFEVLNYATGGYGTYQSLLVLERNLPLLDSSKFVFYGFFDHHEVRNVAPTSWIKTLSNFSKRNHVAVPYMTMTINDSLERISPEKYHTFPLHKHSSIVRLIEKVKDKVFDDGRVNQKRIVTEQIIIEMNKLCKSYGTKFVFVILSAKEDTKRHYKEYLEKKNIWVIDANIELTDELIVKGEGHPNGEVHSKWTDIILADFKRKNFN